jgi:hypothetical protein
MDMEESARLSALFAEVNGQSETLYEGFLSCEESEASAAATVQLVWGKKDLTTATTTKYHAQYHVQLALSGSPSIHRGLFPSNWEVALTSISPSKRYTVTLKLDKGNEATEGVFNGKRSALSRPCSCSSHCFLPLPQCLTRASSYRPSRPTNRSMA